MRTLGEAIAALSDSVEERDVHALRKLSNRCLEKVSLERNLAFLEPAMLAYAFAKVVSKSHYWKDRSNTVFFNNVLRKLGKAAKIADDDEGAALRMLKEVEGLLKELDVSDKRFVRGLMEKARIKVASTLYAQGFSLDSAVEITGAEKRELVRYMGKTMMFDRARSPKTMEQRLKALRKLLS